MQKTRRKENFTTMAALELHNFQVSKSKFLHSNFNENYTKTKCENKTMVAKQDLSFLL